MGIFGPICACIGHLLDNRSLSGILGLSENGHRVFRIGLSRVFAFHHRHVGESGTSSIADNGRNPSMVLFLSFRGRLDALCQEQIQMGIELQYIDVVGVCSYQCAET